MGRQGRLSSCGLIFIFTVLLSSCGGGGGGGSSSSGHVPQQPPGTTPVSTATPLRTVSSRNERTEVSSAGSITLHIQDIDLVGHQTTNFSVFLRDAADHPAAGQHLNFTFSSQLIVTPPDGGLTGSDGSLSGTISAASGGRFALQVSTDAGAPFNGLAVTLTVAVTAPVIVSPTATGPTSTVLVVTPTPTALPCTDVNTLTVQASPLSVTGPQAGSVTITALALDANNQPVANVNVLFDVQPAVGTLSGRIVATGSDGNASVHLDIPANSAPQRVVASANACGTSGSASVDILPGPTSTPTVTPTPSMTPTPSATPVPTVTPTALPCADVKTIIVQTSILNVSGQLGDAPTITAVVFDSNNFPVGNINVLFDVEPRVATFEPQFRITQSDGTATSKLTIPPHTTFGTLTVTAGACNVIGGVQINVVSGASTKPVRSVVLQALPSTASTITGGSINLTAAVLDGDNSPLNDIDVLFITAVGAVNPLTDRTKAIGPQGGLATSSLDIPSGAPAQKYTISALAGGVTGSTVITVVDELVPPGGSVKPGVPPGEPAGIALGASPTHIQVAGTGGTELATIIGHVIDNNGNPLQGVRVHYHVVAKPGGSTGASILPVTVPTPSGSPTPVPTTKCAADDPVSVSDSAGFATIQVHSGTTPGGVTVYACADTTVFDAADKLEETQQLVTVSSGAVNHINVAINGNFVDNNNGTYTTTASALVNDAKGNVVEDGTPVFFEILTTHVCSGGSNDGGLCSSDLQCPAGTCIEDPTDPSLNVAISSDSTTNSSPTCSVAGVAFQPGTAVTCITYPANQQGSEIVVRATAAGVYNNLAGQALGLPGSIGDLEASVNPATVHLTATEDGLAVVTASVVDGNFRGVENVRVHFTTSAGTFASSGRRDGSDLTNVDGDATVTLVIPAGTPSGSATLSVFAGKAQINNVVVPFVNTGGGATPTPGGALQPSGLAFLGASPSTIGVKGSSLPEQSVLTFQVTNGLGVPLQGVTVNFSLSRVADESINPDSAVSDADGKVQVTLTSGHLAGPVQITALVNSVSPALITRSTAVTVFGGPPSQGTKNQPNFSMAHQFQNVSGGVFFGTENIFHAFVHDRFGNPVPPGTVVSFTTKGGAIGNQLPTNALGQAQATLVTEQPVPANGTVSTLATTRGERPFTDLNANGICDTTDLLLPVPEPYYDTNCNGEYDPGEDFVDLNANGVFDTNQGPAVPSCEDQIVVFASICSTFSGPTAVAVFAPSLDPIPAGGSRTFTLIVSDNPDPFGNPGVGNPIVGGSTIAVTVDGSRARVQGVSSIVIGDAFTNDTLYDGINRFHFTVSDNSPTDTTTKTDVVIVQVNSDVNSLPAGGNGSRTVQFPVTFLGAPVATFTMTPTITPTIPPPPTPIGPALAPQQAALAAGTGSPPTACNGASQPFVVTGGSPPFNVFGAGGCVSVSSVPTSGQAFIFTAGNTLGDYTITVTDALGHTASAGVTVQGPATPTPTFTPPNTPTPPNTQSPTPTFTPTLTATATSTPVARSIAFVSAQPSSIGVRRSGLPEQSTLTFKVTDAQARPIANIPVQFTINALGGESVAPLQALTDSTGQVQTVLSSGDRPASVRVIAAVVANPTVTTQSTQVTIVNGLPVANRFHVATEFLNVAGRVTLGLEDGVTAFANDRFGNAVPAGTAITFQGDGGSLVNITPTNAQGQAEATLVSEGTVPSNGIVTLLAFTRGEKAFTDLNGNGVPDPGEPVDPLPEPFFDKNGNGMRDPGESFIDVNQDGIWNADQEPVGAFSDEVVVFDTTRVTFSGPAIVTLEPSTFTIPDGGSQEFTLTVHDDLQNPLVQGTEIAIAYTGNVILQGAPATFTLPDIQTFGQLVDGVNRFTFTMADSQPGIGDTAQPITVSWTVKSPITSTAPGGNGDRVALSAGTLLPVLPPTPTVTWTPTFTLPPTSTPTPFPSGQPTFTPTMTPQLTPTAPVGSIAFVSALPATIGVRASGLPEQAVVTFQAKDTLARPIVGAPVAFQLTGSGSEILNPTAAVTDANGMVTTTVTSGFRATTVRITAEADSNGDGAPDIFVQSQVVGILGAPPAFNHFSLAPERLNVAGRVTFGLTDTISAFVNDRFGNAVPPQTSVSFITNAASVVDPSVTNSSGVAMATLLSEGVVPPSGIVTVLAFTRGEESFLDNNGNGKFDCFPEANPPCHSNIDSVGLSGELDNNPEPRIDFRPLPSTLQPDPTKNDSACSVAAPSELCNDKFDANKPFELFVDSNGNGSFDSPAPNATGNGFGQGTDGLWDNNIFVWSAVPVTFSGHLVTPVAAPTSFSVPVGGAQAFTLEVHDDLLNPIVGGSLIKVSTTVGSISGDSITVPDGESFNQIVDGLTRFSFVLSAGENTGPLVSTSIVVTVTSQNGNGTFIVATGLVPKAQ